MSKITILDAAVMLAMRVGYRNVRRRAVATKAGVATGTVSYHFKTMRQLHDAIIKCGVEHGLAAIVAQGLADGNRYAKNAPQELKDRAAALIAA